METVAYVCLSLAVLILAGLLFFFLLGKEVVIMKSEKDYTYLRNNAFPLIFSIIAILVSVVAIALVCPKSNFQPQMGYLDVIIAILAVLITILLGWQIYNGIRFSEQVIQIKESLKESERIQKEIVSIDLEMRQRKKKDSDYLRKLREAIKESQPRVEGGTLTFPEVNLPEYDEDSDEAYEKMGHLGDTL